MIKNMSGFIDPYSLGLIISLIGIIAIQLTHENTPKIDTYTQQHQKVTNLDHPQQSSFHSLIAADSSALSKIAEGDTND